MYSNFEDSKAKEAGDTTLCKWLAAKDLSHLNQATSLLTLGNQTITDPRDVDDCSSSLDCLESSLASSNGRILHSNFNDI